MYVIFQSLLTHGHLNVCFALGQELRRRGHRVAFVADQQWAQRIRERDFEVLPLEPPARSAEQSAQDERDHQLWVDSWGDPSFYEKQVGEAIVLDLMLDRMKQVDPLLEQLMHRERPDLIMVDHLFKMPYLDRLGAWPLAEVVAPRRVR